MAYIIGNIDAELTPSECKESEYFFIFLYILRIIKI